jgi:zinc transport system substrate-binding protein
MLRQRLAITAFLLVTLLCAAFFCTSCSRKGGGGDGRLQVVATIFPLYDFVRVIGGESVSVQLLLPPGVEAHSFEPKPEDVVRVSRADLFVYTNAEMEPWGEKLLASVAGKSGPQRVEAGAGARYLNARRGTDAGDHDHGHDHGGGRDPHIWLSIANARIMVDTIAAAMAARAPAKRELFLANAAAYRKKLDELDSRFRSGLASCRTREFIHGGHYAFAYLADSYNLTYLSAYGITADSEPSPRRMMELVKTVRDHGLKMIFFEELLAPRVAETVAAETGATLVKLHGIHNVTRQELDSGATYLGLMEQNLANLRKGLECR